MSILLEALKKSEQQRQLGQTPTLQTSVEDQPQTQLMLNHWIPLSLMALSLAVMAWFGWQQFRAPQAGDAPVVPTAIAQTDAKPQARTPTETFDSNDPGPQELAGRPTVPSKEDEDDKARLNQSFNNFTAQSEETDTAALPSDIEAGTPPSPTPLVEPQPLQPSPGPSESEPKQSRLAPHVSEPISYWALPQGVRDNLPEIRITVLVFAEKPDDRFLLANGQRMVEKDELESGLVLDEIRRDGAVFLYRKYRFLVKG